MLLPLLLLLKETEGQVVLEDEAVVDTVDGGKNEGVVGKVEGVVDVEVNGVMEGETVVVVLGRLSDNIDRRV